MTYKEELKKELTELTKKEVELRDVNINDITNALLDKIEDIHKKRIVISKEIAQINEQEQKKRKTY